MDCTQFEKEGRPSFEEIFRSLKELFDELEAEEAAAFVNNSQVRFIDFYCLAIYSYY
jgi:hypothetical protein